MVEGYSIEEEEVEKPEDLCVGFVNMRITMFMTVNASNRLRADYQASIQRTTTTECKDISCGDEEAVEEFIIEFNERSRFNNGLIVPGPIREEDRKKGTAASFIYIRAVPLGCCDYPCPKRYKSETHFLAGSVAMGGNIGRQPGQLEARSVVDEVLAEYGFGGNNPPTFKPCCKKKKSTEAGAPGAI